MREERSPSSRGMSPEKRLYAKFNVLSFVNFAITAPGMGPVNPFDLAGYKINKTTINNKKMKMKK